MDLFSYQASQSNDAPLAARMRPRTLAEYEGQTKIVGEGRLLRRLIERDQLISLILWGPPGTGKTTLARIIAGASSAHFEPLSAVSAGVAELRKVVKEATERRGMYGKRTVLFIDEIHRWNKAQQDAVLPAVEDGTVTLIGATTENPSFEINRALLSRCRVIVLESLEDQAIEAIIERALSDNERGLGKQRVQLSPEARDMLIHLASGDARAALTALEAAALTQVPEPNGQRLIDLEAIVEAYQRRNVSYDKTGELHYDAISALHKSVRDSDPDGALYWMARMLEGGEDPLYVARRVIRMAVEDIGLADPLALGICVAAQQAVHFMGTGEGALALAQAVVYLAQAPKSNAVYRAYGAVIHDVEATRNEPVPLHLRNAVTGLMKGLGYGSGYQYAHDFKDAQVEQEHLPPNLAGHRYYYPTDHGYEARVQQRLAWRYPEDQAATSEASTSATTPQSPPPKE